jgi:N-acyl amino acid synthase of PEP-CTERM/exosortase system
MTALCKTTNEHNHDLIENFLSTFDISMAVTAEQLAASFRMRYRVYCLQERFEPADRYPDGLESDEFDSHALHCLITHRETGILAAGVRLVRGNSTPHSPWLPFEKHCPGGLEPEFIQAHGIRPEKCCEISRLAVDGRFRKRLGEPGHADREGEIDTPLSGAALRTFSLLPSAGFLAATAMSDICGRPDIFAFMQPWLPRLMRRAGYAFQRSGPDVEYNGTRAVYFTRTAQTVSSFQPSLRRLYDAIQDQLAGDFALLSGEQRGPASGLPQTPRRPALMPPMGLPAAAFAGA